MLRRMVAVGVAALCLGGAGCALVRDATSLMIFQVREASEDFGETVRNRKWAEHAWGEVLAANPQAGFSADYAQGFRDGFAHYLYWGGNGEPPALPPHRYRKLRYQTPQGYKAIEDWFAGFRHGAEVARQNGYRQWITGPSSLRAHAAPPPAADAPLPPPLEPAAPPSAPPLIPLVPPTPAAAPAPPAAPPVLTPPTPVPSAPLAPAPALPLEPPPPVRLEIPLQRPGPLPSPPAEVQPSAYREESPARPDPRPRLRVLNLTAIPNPQP